MNDKPLDQRMLDTEANVFWPEGTHAQIKRWANEVTSLLIQVEELKQANLELVRQANREIEHELPF
jgi:hypothetical protein